jgi:MFS family permease
VSTSPRSPAFIVALLSAAEIASMLAVATYPTLLPRLRDGWQLSNSAAGLVGGLFYGGYMAGVPILVGWTDRVDPRRIYVSSALVGAAGALGFATAGGPWMAGVWQVLAGIGLAGTYMPGLRLLADRVRGEHQSRAVAVYTSSYGIGMAVSYWVAGALVDLVGWRATFAIAAAGPIAAAAAVAGALTGQADPAGPSSPRIDRSLGLAIGEAVRHRRTRGYVFGYAAHCWELFGVRSWMVAALAASAAVAPGVPRRWAPATLAAAINLLGPLASLLGNEASLRWGRRETIALAMAGSACLAGAAGLSVVWVPTMAAAAVAVYYVAVMSDSSALTAGLVSVAPADRTGATMAAYSMAGFAAGFVAPLTFGGVLDLAGSNAAAAWALAFGSLGAGSLLGLAGFLSASRPERAASSGYEPP